AFGYSRIVARTMSIEVGMQNSGLGVVLARRHFADPLTAVPGAISAVCHSVLGSLVAGYWRWRPEPPAAGAGSASAPLPEAEPVPACYTLHCGAPRLRSIRSRKQLR